MPDPTPPDPRDNEDPVDHLATLTVQQMDGLRVDRLQLRLHGAVAEPRTGGTEARS